MRDSMGETGRSKTARIVFGLALLASAALLLHYRLKVGFVYDDWGFLKDRSLGDIGSLFEPHNENIVVLQAVLYRVFYILFGIESSVPFQIVSLLFFLLSVVAFFVWMRQRVGEWTAVLASIPLLFLGTAYQDLLWAFQIGYTLSIFGGLVSLIALERGGKYSQPVACIALVVSVATSSLGLPFVAGVAVFLLLRDGWKGLLNYVLIVPVLLFVAWWAGWGRTGQNFISLSNILDSPAYVAESIKSVVMSLTGLHRSSSSIADALAWAVSAIVVGATAISLVRRKALPRPMLVALAIGLAFWVLTAANQVPGMVTREPDQSRYQLPGAVFLLMILAGAFDGYRPGKRFLFGIAVLVAVSVACSLGALSQGQKFLIETSAPPKSSITAMSIAGDSATPEFQVQLAPYFPIFINQEQFHELEDRYGRAGWSESQIAEQSQQVRRLVDNSLIWALGLEVRPESRAGFGRCQKLDASPEGVAVKELRTGQIYFAADETDLVIGVERFSDEIAIPVGEIPAGEAGALAIPADRSAVPWRVFATGEGRFRVCADRLPSG